MNVITSIAASEPEEPPAGWPIVASPFTITYQSTGWSTSANRDAQILWGPPCMTSWVGLS